MKNTKLTLAIANSRGKKPVMRDIKRAYHIINMLMVELNPSPGKTALSKADLQMWKVLQDN